MPKHVGKSKDYPYWWSFFRTLRILRLRPQNLNILNSELQHEFRFRLPTSPLNTGISITQTVSQQKDTGNRIMFSHIEGLEPELAMSKIIVFYKMHSKFQAKSWTMDIAKNKSSD